MPTRFALAADDGAMRTPDVDYLRYDHFADMAPPRMLLLAFFRCGKAARYNITGMNLHAPATCIRILSQAMGRQSRA